MVSVENRGHLGAISVSPRVRRFISIGTELTIPATMLVDVAIFHEHKTWQEWLGALLLMASFAVLVHATSVEAVPDTLPDAPVSKPHGSVDDSSSMEPALDPTGTACSASGEVDPSTIAASRAPRNQTADMR